MAMAWHGARPCPSVRTQPPTATGAPLQTSTMLCPGRHQEQASKQRCTFRPITFSSVQFSSVQSSVQFSSVFQFSFSGSIYAFWFDILVMATFDARGHLGWTSLGIIFFLRSLHSKFSSGPVMFKVQFGPCDVQSSDPNFVQFSPPRKIT